MPRSKKSKKTKRNAKKSKYPQVQKNKKGKFVEISKKKYYLKPHKGLSERQLIKFIIDRYTRKRTRKGTKEGKAKEKLKSMPTSIDLNYGEQGKKVQRELDLMTLRELEEIKKQAARQRIEDKRQQLFIEDKRPQQQMIEDKRNENMLQYPLDDGSSRPFHADLAPLLGDFNKKMSKAKHDKEAAEKKAKADKIQADKDKERAVLEVKYQQEIDNIGIKEILPRVQAYNKKASYEKKIAYGFKGANKDYLFKKLDELGLVNDLKNKAWIDASKNDKSEGKKEKEGKKNEPKQEAPEAAEREPKKEQKKEQKKEPKKEAPKQGAPAPKKEQMRPGFVKGYDRGLINEHIKEIKIRLSKHRLTKQQKQELQEQLDYLEQISDSDQEGTGLIKLKKEGISSEDINKILSRHSDYVGCYARDELHKALPLIKPHSRFGLVLNLDPASKPGSHWCALYCDARPEGSHSVEYFNSLADPMPKDLLKEIKPLVDKLHADTYLKFKENKIRVQSDRSNECGFFACKFLIDRFRGKPFVECLPHSNVAQGEKDIKKFEAKYI